MTKLLEFSHRKTETGRFASPMGGQPIFYKVNYPTQYNSSSKLTHIFIIHGLSEYHARHYHLPNHILEKDSHNYIFSWIDLKGHGLSGGKRSYIDSFSEFCADVTYWYNYLNNKLEHPVTHRFLVGHSMGGLVTLKTMLEHSDRFECPVDGLVLSNPCIKVEEDIPEAAEKFLNKLSTFTRNLRFSSKYTGFHLTHDHQEALDFNTDPLIQRFITVGLLHELLEATKKIRPLSYYLEVPTLFLTSSEDKLVDHRATALFERGMPHKKRKIINYEGLYHELFNEIGKEKIFKDVMNWLQDINQTYQLGQEISAR